MVSIAAVTSLGGSASDTIQGGADGIENAPTTTAAIGCSDIHPDGYATGAGYHTDCFSPTVGPYNL